MNRLVVASVLFLAPTVLIAAWAAQFEIARALQPSMRVAIVGYDPRDLLRGHHLEFRLDLRGVDGVPCACLRPDPADPLRPVAEPADCAAPPPVCDHFIAAPRQVFRYYASEERALDLERLLTRTPGGASVVVHFEGDGAVSFSGVAAGRADGAD